MAPLAKAVKCVFWETSNMEYFIDNPHKESDKMCSFED